MEALSLVLASPRPRRRKEQEPQSGVAGCFQVYPGVCMLLGNGCAPLRPLHHMNEHVRAARKGGWEGLGAGAVGGVVGITYGVPCMAHASLLPGLRWPHSLYLPFTALGSTPWIPVIYGEPGPKSKPVFDFSSHRFRFRDLQVSQPVVCSFTKSQFPNPCFLVSRIDAFQF